YAELKELFPHNRVEYFISYYDYYQPESYLPTTDTYIEKDSSVNAQIEKMRLKATSALLSREDVIVVASISCIYGLGDPGNFLELSLGLIKGQKVARQDLIRQLIEMQYERNDQALEPGKFRVRGDVIDVMPSYDEEIIRIELFGDEIESIQELDHVTGIAGSKLDNLRIFPAKQFVVPKEKQKKAIGQIREELKGRMPQLAELERQRLSQRVRYDLEMIGELGYCSGIENYSRHFDGRKPGEPPFVLLNYFPKDFLFIIDESHQSIPQSHGMYKGDFARKKNLVDFGFRLPCAYDNRPLKFSEFEKYFNHTVFVSATPSEYEVKASGQVVELIIRPTGLLDPLVEVRGTKGHIQDLLVEIRKTIGKKERVLVTTLTKRMAEDLTDFLSEQDVKVRYLHSDIDSLDRIELIRQLRAGEFDVLVGINLLREGLDLPEVSLIAILDADKESFLRDERSLIQTIGRAARNVNGRVIMYGDRVSGSMRRAIDITARRREEQSRYNKKHGITPATIVKSVAQKTREIKGVRHIPKEELHRTIIDLEANMRIAAQNLDFEKAIELRDAIAQIKAQM
ncbi:MAG TPA: excinuclease ABC subunit UvrB, partial [Candidatus Nanoarchaeia archaeon]|nr:excinuclease ABC subunit UvrB [Candidatus Nanoarchaeia archaeon]